MDAGVRVVDQDMAERTLLRVACNVLERFANIFTEPADDAIAFSSGECLFGQACFHGGVVGVVSLAAPIGLCKAIAAGSISGEATDADLTLHASHALGELANVIAGNIATVLDPDDPIWLSPPAVATSSFDDWMVLGSAQGTLRFNVEGWPLLASLAIAQS